MTPVTIITINYGNVQQEQHHLTVISNHQSTLTNKSAKIDQQLIALTKHKHD
jgi:hypothetical protein